MISVSSPTLSSNTSSRARGDAMHRSGGISMLMLVLSLTGCARHLGVPESQLLEYPLPQLSRTDRSASDVWSIVSFEPQRRSGTVIVEDPVNRVLTWVEEVDTWNDLNTDAIPYNGFDTAMTLKKVRKREKPSRSRKPVTNIAITTIWVEPDGGGCVLRVRRVYYGSNTHVCLGHSRGDYERDLYSRIDKQSEPALKAR